MNISDLLTNIRSTKIYNQISNKITDSMNELNVHIEVEDAGDAGKDVKVQSSSCVSSPATGRIITHRFTRNRPSLSVDESFIVRKSNHEVEKREVPERTADRRDDEGVPSKVAFCTDFNQFLLKKNEGSPYSSSYKRNPYGRLIGNLDPSIYMSYDTEDYYDIPAGHFGRVWFSIAYVKEEDTIQLTLHKARNLRGFRRTSFQLESYNNEELPQNISANNLLSTILGNDPNLPSDCRIKVFLESNEKKSYITSVQKHTANPDFEEKFTFLCPLETIAQQRIHFEVQMADKMKHWKNTSYVNFPLSDFVKLSEPDSLTKSIRLFRDLNAHERIEVPQILISLSYFPATQRITVGLFDCKNMTNRKYTDVYLKVSLNQGLQGKEVKSRRTETLRGRLSFNESFSFTKIYDPNDFNIRISLVQQGIFDKVLTFIVLGNRMVSKGNAADHWEDMIRCGLADQNTCSDWHEFVNFQ